ncbi:MAG: DUF2834 domain-containing protein [Gammaproteobacteria bacterium]|nr:DUF2834 domain-containing protein [Gammaproteobacteria bacterium]MDG2337022.1 DUF2834 domain-containing protein [Gammaproteobacteria bacterium]
MNLRTIYLLFAILGAVIPVAFFADFAVDQGIDLVAFVMVLFVNGEAGGFTADLLISSFVFWIYMFSNQSDGPKPWVFIALNLCIGLSCAPPAYLWSRTRPSS